jgi:hypothetical protein
MLWYLRRRAVTRALSGSGRGWTALAVVLVAARILNRALGNETRVVLREELPAGQSLVISHLDRNR